MYSKRGGGKMLERHRDLKEHLLKEYSLQPEFIDGLTSLIEESEDFTCFTLKMIMGRRDKGSSAITFTSLSASTTPRKNTGESCSESREVV
jgi:uncharacterized phosphosugar-binding protein